MTALQPMPSAQALMPRELEPLSDHEFELLRGLIHQEAGIYLAPAKRALLAGRLSRRLRELGLRSYRQYYQRVVEGDEAERVRMLDCICTNETHFFRDTRHFDLLEQRILPGWQAEAEAGKRERVIRVWSAACSSGEEPYSVAMLLRRFFPVESGWVIDILATDLSMRVLHRAEAGVWPVQKAAEIPESYLKAFMLRGVGPETGRMKASEELRRLIRFRRVNLNASRYDVEGRFDLLFCRNVLMYFDAETRRRVARQLLSKLAPRGYLFVGHAESLHGLAHGVRAIIPAVYTPSRSDPERAA